jgi:hypothetical protein
MLRSHGNRRLLATLVLPLLAASLACSTLTGGSAGAALTQAAATVNAAANPAATAQAAVPTSAPILTQAPTAEPPTAASTPTVAPGATTLATEAVTGTPAGADTPTTSSTAPATPGGAVVLDPCTLFTVAEAQSLTGVPMGTPKPQSGSCVIADAATGQSSGVVVYALPASQAQAFLNQFVPSLKQSGVTVPAALEAKLTQDTTAGDMVAAVNDLLAMSLNQPKFKAEKLEGVGSAALWSWNTVLTLQEGLLVAAKPGAVVALALIAGASAKEADAKPAMQQLVGRILDGLPASFTVAGLQVVGSAPALDPCSLASASDIDPVMGTQSEDGVASQGQCNFVDVATHNLAVRVFALPAGVSAQNALTLAALTMLAGNQTAQAKVTADLTAGNLVAAVTDLGASVQSGPGYYLEITHGLGDAGFLSVQTVGTHRVAYFLAAKAGALVAVEGSLGPGDDKANSAAARAILEHILATLPDKFTVNGVP